MYAVEFRPVGVVHTGATVDEIRAHTPGLESVVEVFREFEPALEGIDGYSHIFVLGCFNQLRPEQVGPLRVKPKAMLRSGLKLEELPSVGVFALDSPTRPNPVGLSLAGLVKRDGNVLTVSGLDYFDGTPVLDIKPYNTNYRADVFTRPEWLTSLLSRDIRA